MTIKNAQSKLERAGFSVTLSDFYECRDAEHAGQVVACRMSARRPGSRNVVEIVRNGVGENVATIRVRSTNDHDEMESDYCAGSFQPSVTAAIATVARWDGSDSEQAVRHPQFALVLAQAVRP